MARSGNWNASTASNNDGARLPVLIGRDNKVPGVWPGTTDCLKGGEAFLAEGMLTSNIHQRKPHRRAVPKRAVRASAKSQRCAPLSSTSLPVPETRSA